MRKPISFCQGGGDKSGVPRVMLSMGGRGPGKVAAPGQMRPHHITGTSPLVRNPANSISMIDELLHSLHPFIEDIY